MQDEKKKEKKKNANTDRPRHTAPPLGRFDHLICSPHEACSPWLSPGFLLPPLHASPLSSLQILIWEPMGATKPQPTNPTSSFSLEARVHLVFPCLKAFSLPPLIVPSMGSGPAWPLDHTPTPKPLPGPVSGVEMSNAAGGEISKSTSLPSTNLLVVTWQNLAPPNHPSRPLNLRVLNLKEQGTDKLIHRM